MTVEECRKRVQDRLSKKRYTHSINVAEAASELARRWNADQEKAYLAGVLHDCCKEIPQEEQRQMAEKSPMGVTVVELHSPPLWHAVAGAWYAKEILGVDDMDVLNAIRYHTVARAGMSKLEEILYLADLISADRTYRDVEKMRKLAFTSLDKAMLEGLCFSITDVVGKLAKLPFYTIEAYNQYVVVKGK